MYLNLSEMTDFLIFTRRTDIRKISLEVEYFADVIIPVGELKNAIAIDVDGVTGRQERVVGSGKLVAVGICHAWE